VLLTQEVTEKQMNQALDVIRKQESTKDIGCLLRVL
jgi:hypothetical protein